MTAPTGRAALVRDAVWWDCVAEQAKARAQAARQVLAAEASAELERDGIAPTWRIPGLGTVPLGVTSDTVVVDDADAYTKWVADRYPTEVETVAHVRGVFDGHLRRAAAERGDPPCDPKTGKVIPGLRFVAGGQPRGIQIRPDSAAKEALSQVASGWLDSWAPDGAS
jgi:hypothetical protein